MQLYWYTVASWVQADEKKGKIIMRIALLNSWEPQTSNGQQTQEISHARQDMWANMTVQIPREEHHKNLVRSLCLPKAHLSIDLYCSRENKKLQAQQKDNTVLWDIIMLPSIWKGSYHKKLKEICSFGLFISNNRRSSRTNKSKIKEKYSYFCDGKINKSSLLL